ncbi:MAG: ABC transporter ATP-binding protein [Oscillospiraceae bacterium]|nr:ABC transporter ATP-binding protein [Oscillospiraceae bacterium]
MLELSHITKKYGGKTALSDVSLTLPRGQIVGLFGENGAGKTTLMKCVLGLLRHDGAVTLDGAPIGRDNIEKLSFATSEHSFFPGYTAQAHREFYAAHFPRFNPRRYAALMDFFSLPEKKPLRSFSTGMKNQFEVILALSQGADYILMDEPFAGNDVFNREDFYKVLLGLLDDSETVLLSTHLLEEVKGFVSRAVLLHEGRIVGDCLLEDLEEQGTDLMAYVKKSYGYRPDRVSQALKDLADEREEGQP